MTLSDQQKRVAAGQDTDTARRGKTKDPRLSRKPDASSVVFQKDVGQPCRAQETGNQVAASNHHFPKAQGSATMASSALAASTAAASASGERQAVFELRIAAKRQDFPALAGDDLAAGDEKQTVGSSAAGDKAVGFVRSMERPGAVPRPDPRRREISRK